MKNFQLIPLLCSLYSVTLAQSFCNASGHSDQSLKLTGNEKERLGRLGDIDYEIWADGGRQQCYFLY